MKRFLMRISYDGTFFNGWQSQKNGRTVQQEIEKALSEIAKQPIGIIGSGRTDAGVHALRQYAHFDFPVQMTSKQITSAIRSKLPPDISVTDIFPVTNDFHARYNAIQRKYLYFVTTNLTPFNRFYRTYFPKTFISITKIHKCLPYFRGNHDFTSFSKFNPDIKNNLCEIYHFSCMKKKDDIIFEISANRFLHNMVRRIVGTIINISRTDTNPEIIPMLFEMKRPQHKLISTSPSQGLFLADVNYPPELFLENSHV